MNEQIRELLEKVTKRDYWSADQHRYLVDYVNQEKFAELIIRECAEIADTHWRNQCPGFYIKEHFGVKE